MDQDQAFEKRLIALERRQVSNQNLYIKLKRDAIALWQELWSGVIDANTLTPTPTPTPTPTLNTGVSGTLTGCTTAGIPGIVEIDDLTPAMLAMYTTSAGGTWSGTIYLASNTAVTITATPTSPRFATTTISRTLTAGSSNVGLNITATAAAGYACTSACMYPIKTTLNLTSAGTCSGIAYPSDTLTYQALPAWLAAATGKSNGWLGVATWSASYGAHGAGTWNYLVFEGSGQLLLDYVDLGAHFSAGSKSLGAANCPTSSTAPGYTVTLSCANPFQAIGCTIAE